MSLKLNERYPGRMNNPSADYPQGSFKNRTTPDAKDGSYLEKDWANDKEGFFQSLLSKAGVLANGLIDKVGASQYFDALIQTRQVQTGVAFTSAGVSPALTLTPSPAITAYSANQRFRVKFAAASTGSDTLNISGLGAKNIKQYSSAGAKVAAVFAASQLSDVEYDGVDFVLLDRLPSLPQATEAVLGGAKIATQAQTNAGADDATIVTPKKLKAAFPAGNLVKAWCNFNGTGTPAIRSASGFSSVIDNGVGDYTLMFTTPKADANFAAVASGTASSSPITGISCVGVYARSTTSVSVSTTSSSASRTDFANIDVAVFSAD